MHDKTAMSFQVEILPSSVSLATAPLTLESNQLAPYIPNSQGSLKRDLRPRIPSVFRSIKLSPLSQMLRFDLGERTFSIFELPRHVEPTSKCTVANNLRLGQFPRAAWLCVAFLHRDMGFEKHRQIFSCIHQLRWGNAWNRRYFKTLSPRRLKVQWKSSLLLVRFLSKREVHIDHQHTCLHFNAFSIFFWLKKGVVQGYVRIM